MFAAKVVNLRPGPFGNALAYFNVVVGEEDNGEFTGALVLKDFVLKHKKDGTSYYWQAPAKKRMRDGSAVKDAKGFDVWDEYMTLYAPDGEKQPTGLSFDTRSDITAQAVKLFEGSTKSASGRGSVPAKAAPAKRTGKPAPQESSSPTELEDDLPF
jgi:hypothetical protein